MASPGAGDLVYYYVRVLMFVPGDLLHHVDRAYFVPPLLHSIGEMLGKVDKALMVCFYIGNGYKLKLCRVYE